MTRSEAEQGRNKPHGIHIDQIFEVQKYAAARKEAGMDIQGVRNDLAWINGQYFEGERQYQISATQARDMAAIGLWLPSYLVLRAERPLHQTSIPNHVTNLLTASQGLYAVTSMYADMYKGSASVTPDGICRLGHIPLNSEVRPDLAGSEVDPEIIAQTAAALLLQTDGNADESELGGLIADDEFNRLFDFSLEAQSYNRFSHDHEFTISFLTAATRDAKTVPLDGILIASMHLDALREDAKNHRLKSQREINQALGRNPDRVM